MATIEQVKNQMQTLLNNANATTGKTDTTLTNGVNSLINGFGGSGTFSMFTPVVLWRKDETKIHKDLNISFVKTEVDITQTV